MLNRIKKLWALKDLDSAHLEDLLQRAAKDVEEHTPIPIRGDGKAVFYSDMTEAEYEAYERDEVRGWGKFWGKK